MLISSIPSTVSRKTGPTRMRAPGTAAVTLHPADSAGDGQILFWWTPETQDPNYWRFSTPEVLTLRPAKVGRFQPLDSKTPPSLRHELELPLASDVITATVPYLRFNREENGVTGTHESATWNECRSDSFVLERALNWDGSWGPPTTLTFIDPLTGLPGANTFPLANSGWVGYDVDCSTFPDGRLRIDGRAVTNNRIWVSFDRSCRDANGRPTAEDCPGTVVEMWFDDEEGTAIPPGDITMGFD